MSSDHNTASEQVAASVPRFSVVMPVHDAEAFLDAAIVAIEHQTFEDWELVVVDDDGDLFPFDPVYLPKFVQVDKNSQQIGRYPVFKPAHASTASAGSKAGASSSAISSPVSASYPPAECSAI